MILRLLSQDWPANIQKRKKEEEAKKQEEEENRKKQKHAPPSSKGDNDSDDDKENHNPTEEHDWKRSQGDDSKHNDAYASGGGDSDGKQQTNGSDDKKPKSEYEKLRERYSPQEIALLRSLQNEKEYISKLKQNNGRRISPVKGHNRTTITIDEADQFTPDNWIPRSTDLIRLTGKHPLNAEPDLTKLFDAGLITPNELHYVRNHGPVPRLLWEKHTLDM